MFSQCTTTLGLKESDADTLSSYPSESSLSSLADKYEKTISVNWGSVQIREYNRIVGDHPETLVGPPLTLDWHYIERQPISLDEYEEQRPEKKVFFRLRLSSVTRKNLLKNEFGISDEEIAAAEKEIQLTRKQREASSKQGKISVSVETAFQAARRKLRKRFSRENLMMGLSALSSGISPIPMVY